MLEKEAEEWLRKFLLCNDCKRKCHCIELNAYCEEQVLKAYTDSAEPREKRIAELEEKLAEETAQRIYNFNKSIEWKEKYRELKKENAELKKKNLDTQDAVLKKKNLDTQDAVTMQIYTNKADKEIADKQLTKAKEIVKYLLGFIKQEGYRTRWDINIVQAEQFLNSEVEK